MGKVPDFIRSLSKERKKNKDKVLEQEGDEEKGEEEAPKNEDADVEAAGEEGAAEKDAEDGEEAPKDTKTKVKEAIENIHMPKLPKIHKPALLKKKKATEEDGEEAEADDKDKEKDEEAAEENEEKEEKKEGEGEEEEKEEEAGDKEESKELLEKKEEDGEKEGEEAKETEEKPDAEQKEGEVDTKEPDQTDGKAATSRGAALLESIRSVASHVPAIFRKPKVKDTDVEAGEKDELLDKQEDSNKKEEGDELKEVKTDDGGSPVKKDHDAASHDSEKKDPKKTQKTVKKHQKIQKQ